MSQYSTRIVFNQTTPKQGYEQTINEDCSRVSTDCNIIAIADGVSSAAYSRDWATLICDRATDNFQEFSTDVNEWFQVTQKQHLTKMREIVLDMVSRGEALPFWWEQKILVEGARATLIVCEIKPESQEAVIHSIGDSFAFHILNGQIIDHNTISHCQTGSVDKGKLTQKIITKITKLQKSSQILLTTDAIGNYLLEYPSELEELLQAGLGSEADYFNFVDVKRAENKLKDDDCTVVLIDLKDELKKFQKTLETLKKKQTKKVCRNQLTRRFPLLSIN